MNNQRSRSWRRFKNKINSNKGMGCREAFKPEKKWKMVYLRSEKLSRAMQLGFEYPRVKLDKFYVEDQAIYEKH